MRRSERDRAPHPPRLGPPGDPDEVLGHVDDRLVAEAGVDPVGGRVGPVGEQAHPVARLEAAPGQLADDVRRDAAAAELPRRVDRTDPRDAVRRQAGAGQVARSCRPAASHSHSTPSRIRTEHARRGCCAPRTCGSGSRPACSSASAWKASNQASTSSASSSVAGRSRPSGAGGTSTEVASQQPGAPCPRPISPGQLGGLAGRAPRRRAARRWHHRGARRARAAARAERAGRVVGHRHREGRVGRERRRPHRRARPPSPDVVRARPATSARTVRRPRPTSRCRRPARGRSARSRWR